MRENEFEQRVQQKMEDFDLPPSAGVWTAVEQRIRKEKKRRFIFWWPLLFLLAAGGIATLLTNKKVKKEAITLNEGTRPAGQSSTETITGGEPAGNSKDLNPGKKDSVVISSTNSNQPGSSPEKITLVPGTGNKPTANKITLVERPTINSPGNYTVTGNKPGKVQSHQPPLTVINPSKQTHPLPGTTSTNDIDVVTKKEIKQKEKEPGIDPVRPEQNQPVIDPGKTDAIPAQINPEKTQENSVQVQLLVDSSKLQKSSVTKKMSKKWDWRIYFSGGRSSIAEGLRFSDRLLYADAMSPQTSTGATTFPGTSSAIKRSFSWSAGLSVKQSLSPKLDLTIGVGYSYLSTKFNTGSRVDSTRLIANSNSRGLQVSNFYRSGGNASYTNRYHFMNLSADISWRIVNGQRFKLDWENGLSYQLLAGTNMLHYDRGLPGYYQDNQLLTRNHLFYSTGISVPVGKRVMINPFLAYSLTRVLKNGDSLRTHFTNAGLRIRFLLNKKR